MEYYKNINFSKFKTKNVFLILVRLQTSPAQIKIDEDRLILCFRDNIPVHFPTLIIQP